MLMLAVAAADIFGRALPLRFDQAPWRLGLVGILTLGLPTMLLAVLAAALAAWRLEHRAVLRIVAVSSVAGGVILLAMLPFFMLDVLEMQRLIQPEARGSFYATMARAALTALAAAAVALWLGVAAWRATGGSAAAREQKAKARRASGRSDGVLVRQD